MPTIPIPGPYRFYFYSRDESEPIHVHVDREKYTAKFWVDPTIALAYSKGYNARELRKIERIIVAYEDFIREKWDEHFGA